MNVTTTLNKKSVTARSGNVRATVTLDPNEPIAAGHGRAARRLVAKVVPAHRRVEIQNSVKCTKATDAKSVFAYKD